MCENCAVPKGTQYFSHFTQGLTTPTRAKTARVGDPGTPWANLVPPRGAGFCAICSTVQTRTAFSHVL